MIQIEELKLSLENQAKEDAAEVAADDAQEAAVCVPAAINDVSSLVKPKAAAAVVEEEASNKRKSPETEESEVELKKSKTDEEQAAL